MKSISAALDECGIPYVPLKGSIIRDLYPVPELRRSSDIDVLVRENDLDKAVQVLDDYSGVAEPPNLNIPLQMSLSVR